MLNMKHIKSRIKMSIAVLLFCFRKTFFGFLSSRNLGKTRVLVFHHLDNPAQLDRVFWKLNHSYNIISFDQYLSGDIRKDRINIVISFDDGYQSWFCYGKDIFKKYEITPLLFINSDFINLKEAGSIKYCEDQIHTWPEESLSWQEVISLKGAGAEIGGHSSGHIDMILAQGNRDFLLSSIRSDRERIENNTGQLPRSFAYPFGRYNDQAKSIVRESGYTYGFTSDSGFLDDSLDCFALRRTNIGMRPILVVEAMIEGWYDIVTDLWQFFKKYFH